MPTESVTEDQALAPERVPQSGELDAEVALRADAVEQIQRRRRFKVHAIVIAIVTPLVGLSWMLTEYYTAHTHHMWPSSFADAPADRPGVWSTWFFYFLGVMAIVLAIDAYKTYAKPYMNRHPTAEEINSEIARTRIRS
jgi:2TM domain-containing protein